MITEKQLVKMRSQAQDTLSTFCQRKRVTLTPDGAGGQTKSEATLSTQCRISAITAREITISGKVVMSASWRLAVPAGFDVLPEDILVTAGRSYLVGEIQYSTIETSRICLCQLL